MNTVPTMISTKDLAYIKDIFEWNLNASKLALHFSKEAQMEEVKVALMKVATMHSEHCKQLVNILK